MRHRGDGRGRGRWSWLVLAASTFGPMAPIRAEDPGPSSTWALSELPSNIGRAAFAPDGRTLAFAGDIEVLLFDLASDRIRETLLGHSMPVAALAFSPDGSWLASAGGEHGGRGEVILWDMASGRLASRLADVGGRVEDLGFDRDGRALIAAGDPAGETGGLLITRWDVETGALRSSARVEVRDTLVSAIAPDGLTVAAGDRFGGPLLLCDAVSGEILIDREGAQRGGIFALAFSPDGSLLASAADEPPAISGPGPQGIPPSLKVWEVTDGRLIERREHPVAGVLAFSPDGRRLAASRGGISIWDSGSGRTVAAFVGFGMGPADIAFSPDGATLATVESPTVRLWDVATGRVLRELRARRATALAYAPDGRTLAAGFDDGTVALRDEGDDRPRLVLGGASGRVTALAFAPDGDWLAVADEETVRFWQPEDGRGGGPISFSSRPSVPPTSLALSPDGEPLAVGRADGTVQLWDWDDDSAFPRLRPALRGHEGTVIGIAFSPDGGTLLSASHDGTVRWWDVAEGRERRSIRVRPYLVYRKDDGMGVIVKDESEIPEEHRDRVEEGVAAIEALALSPDGRTVAVGTASGYHGPALSLRDAASGRERAAAQPNTSPFGGVEDLAFSPDGRTVAVGGYSIVILIDAETGEARATLKAGGMGSCVVTFSPDGTTLAAGGAGFVRTWDLEEIPREAAPE